MGNLIFTTLYILVGILLGSPAFAQSEVNLLKNPGFESRTSQWSKTGSSTFSIESSAPLSGVYSGIWDASATGEFFRSSTYTIPAGLKGVTCVIQMKYLWDSGTSGHILMNVDDGTNNIAQLSLEPTSSATPRTAQLSFTCPTSGTLRFELESTANASAINVDDMFVGTGKSTVQISQAELYAGVIYNNVAGCDVTTTSGTVAEVADDADCNSRSASGNAQFVNNQFKMRVPRLPKGTYELAVMVPIYSDTSGTACEVYINTTAGSMPTTYAIVGFQTAVGNNPAGTTLVIPWNQASDVGQTDFYMSWRRTGGAGTCHMATVNAGGVTFSMSLKKYPLQSAEALTLETTGWRVDANIGGSNPGFNTSADQSAYVGLEDGGLDLVNNAGSGNISAQIPCSSTNPSTGLTCSAGNEMVGVVFNVPAAGDVLACVSGSSEIGLGASGTVIGSLQIVETPNNAQTILQEGKSRVSIQGRVPSSIENQPFRVCGTFSFSSAGQKTLRLMYESDVTATVNSWILLADRASSNGQRDLHWEVYPLNQQMPAPVFTEVKNKVNTMASGLRVVAASIAGPSAGTCVVSNESGDWISGTPTSPGTGQCSITLVGSIFSAAPSCTCTTRVNGRTCSLTTVNTSTIASRTVLGTSGADDNAAVDIICMGAQ